MILFGAWPVRSCCTYLPSTGGLPSMGWNKKLDSRRLPHQFKDTPNKRQHSSCINPCRGARKSNKHRQHHWCQASLYRHHAVSPPTNQRKITRFLLVQTFPLKPAPLKPALRLGISQLATWNFAEGVPVGWSNTEGWTINSCLRWDPWHLPCGFLGRITLAKPRVLISK